MAPSGEITEAPTGSDLASLDPEGTDMGCLIPMLIGAPLVAAVPFVGGLVVATLGYVWARAGKNERLIALRHRIDEPVLPLREARRGARVTLAGKIRGPATVKTPLGQEAVVAALWIDDEVGDEVEDPNAPWTKQLGSDVVVNADGGRIVLGEPRDIISHKSQTTVQYGGEPPAFAPLTPEEKEAIGERGAQYGERWLEPDMEVVVTGVVEAVEEVTTAAEVGYRGQRRSLRVRLAAPPGEAILVSSYAPRRIAELARGGRAQVIGGIYMVVVGLLSLVIWGVHFN